MHATCWPRSRRLVPTVHPRAGDKNLRLKMMYMMFGGQAFQQGTDRRIGRGVVGNAQFPVGIVIACTERMASSSQRGFGLYTGMTIEISGRRVSWATRSIHVRGKNPPTTILTAMLSTPNLSVIALATRVASATGRSTHKVGLWATVSLVIAAGEGGGGVTISQPRVGFLFPSLSAFFAST